ncbi:hypothetical protein LMG28688_05616 [Paraburkholderia caffeinitolerans]|uniref:Uncharacterized protein n=1 Tax=Paraburkholderia caffeinitolerans TaxID=1723730 RepID=A0A6J5GKE2_9BURK|nr:hypothetical protein LMG28688_05616 [Paraburkholderia caffeinitolerans]
MNEAVEKGAHGSSAGPGGARASLSVGDALARTKLGGLVSYHFDGDSNPPQDEKRETYHRLAQAFYKTFP